MGGGLPPSILAVRVDAIQDVLRGSYGLDQALEDATIDVAALQLKLAEGKRQRKHISKCLIGRSDLTFDLTFLTIT
jgi:hypothetical protein